MPVIMLGWTVNYEMFFYAAFAGVIFLSRRRTCLLSSPYLRQS